MVFKKQSRTCSHCLSVETRIVSQEESVFTENAKYFLNWRSNCKQCNRSDWESICEIYLTENPEEMKMSDSLIDSWRIDDEKSFNPQNDAIEFSNQETQKILNWIDQPDTTALKRKILVESLCYRLDDLISENPESEKGQWMIAQFQQRKQLIKGHLDLVDSETQKVILGFLLGD